MLISYPHVVTDKFGRIQPVIALEPEYCRFKKLKLVF